MSQCCIKCFCLAKCHIHVNNFHDEANQIQDELFTTNFGWNCILIVVYCSLDIIFMGFMVTS